MRKLFNLRMYPIVAVNFFWAPSIEGTNTQEMVLSKKSGIYPILLILLLTITSCNKSEKVYYDTGELKELINIDDKGQKHGEYKRFDIDGTVLESATYDHGLQIGKRVIYFEKNKVEQESEYQQGVMHGILKVYYRSGGLKTEATYTNGEMNGSFKQYNEDGSIKEVLNFEANEENGPFEEYYPSGKIKWKGSYYNGKEIGKLELFDEKGTLLKTMQYDSIGLGVTTYRKEGYVDPVAYE
jgi:antitoxin component YwqK of YwqJK toxin-antitoxin module